ncbi:addiction module antidote protein, HigA family [Aeromonas veronii]|uniref:Addiction module antidote protein, HigA family n=1 Tax=Aeromonas veronii TaxID=654 RepID=A0A3A9IUY6_AERVE|nr:HigA family addiction module antitoxin [Aeromonas veronii]RKJ92173.1 addiction module antidote protein, HigA family [Aeromonas veronii]
MAEMYNPPHPGALIKENMEALGLSARRLAAALGVAPSTVQRVLAEKSEVSPEMALRLAAVIGSSAPMWLAMQDAYNLWQARQHVDLSGLHRLCLA